MILTQDRAYTGIDYFRVIAAFLVIAIHTSPLFMWSPLADFALTRIIARVAVPFFFMASGFFLFAKAARGPIADQRLGVFVKKTALVYGIAVLCFIPLNLYAGTTIEWQQSAKLFKDIVFNGTFYHLWYLPASIIGACIVWLLLKTCSFTYAWIMSLLLYIIGLLGDSYYSVVEKLPILKEVYQELFLLFDYTRNGIFFAPVFLLMGAWLAQQKTRLSLRTCYLGLTLSLALMLSEGLLLHNWAWQRHDSMYAFLLPCMYFLFQTLLHWRGRAFIQLRNLSLLIYLVHPAMIVVIRGIAKAIGQQKLLIDNSLVHFIVVSLGSLLLSALLMRLAPILDAVLPQGQAKSRSKTIKSLGNQERAWVEIQLGHLKHNASVLQRAISPNCKLMAVVKADAYGHGAEQVSLCLEQIGIDAFAVATIDEGMQLREQGIKGEILILGYTPPSLVDSLVHYDLTQTVVDAPHAAELQQASMKLSKQLSVHVKVNTGMNRLGENADHLTAFTTIFQYTNLKITGIYTHLAASDSLMPAARSFTNKQIQRFYLLLDKLKEQHLPIPKIHLLSSYGAINYPDLSADYARIGIALYGIWSLPPVKDCSCKSQLDLQPVLSLKARVVLVRALEAGESISYGGTFVAQHKTSVAVLSIGYADGLPRCLSNKQSYVLINGCQAKIVGRICMDQLMVDITSIPTVKRGDVATLIGTDGAETITAQQVAQDAGTITNELMSRLQASRLKRVFIDG